MSKLYKLAQAEHAKTATVGWTDESVAAFADGEIRKVVRQSCKLTCFWCNNGVPVQERDAKQTANGHPFWHNPEGNVWSICRAESLRREFGVADGAEGKGT